MTTKFRRQIGYFAADLKHLGSAHHITLTEREFVRWIAGTLIVGAASMLALIWMLAQ